MKRFTGNMLGLFIIAILPVGLIAADPVEDAGCVRGEPAALFSVKSPGVQTHSFKKISPNEAEENVVFKSGDVLRIRNWGCEYFVNTFHYESKGIEGTVSDMAYWFIKAAEVLRTLTHSKPHVSFDLGKAANTLEINVKNSKELSFDHLPYPVEGDGTDFLQAQVVVKSGGRLAGTSMGYVEFELSKGPL